MKAILLAIIALSFTMSKESVAGPCDTECAALKGCPINYCVGIILAGKCTPYCSTTFQTTPSIQFYSNGKTIDLVPAPAASTNQSQ